MERTQPERVIEALLGYLAEAPELRVGQAIALATQRALGHFDPFSIDDAVLAKSLIRLKEEMVQQKRSS